MGLKMLQLRLIFYTKHFNAQKQTIRLINAANFTIIACFTTLATPHA